MRIIGRIFENNFFFFKNLLRKHNYQAVCDISFKKMSLGKN